MKSTMKVGSVLRVPGVSTWSYTSTDPPHRQWKRWQRMARRIAAQIPLCPDWRRASGECICEDCGLEYFDHPTCADPHCQIRVLCNGNQVKL